MDVTNFTWPHLLDLLIDLVDNDWGESMTYRFYWNNEEIFSISSNPTFRQPGNGIVCFPNEHFSLTWLLLHQGLMGLVRLRIDFGSSIDILGFTTDEFKAMTLLLFEIARRVEEPPFLTRQQTSDAIHKVLQSGRSEENIMYYTFYLIKMFRGKPKDFGYQFSFPNPTIEQAYDIIMRRETDEDKDNYPLHSSLIDDEEDNISLFSISSSINDELHWYDNNELHSYENDESHSFEDDVSHSFEDDETHFFEDALSYTDDFGFKDVFTTIAVSMEEEWVGEPLQDWTNEGDSDFVDIY